MVRVDFIIKSIKITVRIILCLLFCFEKKDRMRKKRKENRKVVKEVFYIQVFFSY